MAFHPILYLYDLLQRLIIFFFSPKAPHRDAPLPGPRVAVIGAGLTGVSAAAHCVSHGSDVRIFEANGKVGGIWSRVNHTSGLQIHSIMYRFHPSVNYSTGEYPKREEILHQIEGVWWRYGLEEKTHFNTKVTEVRRLKNGKWIINGNEDWKFDGIIAAVGTCGDPKVPHVPGQEKFEGKIVHSSQLDGIDMKDKNVIIIGGGSSAVEALEYAASSGAKSVNLLARSDKWIIPRNPIVDALLSLNILGAETYFSYIPEWFLRRFFYRELSDLAPPHGGEGIWESTPMVNDQVLEQIRSGTARWLRGDINEIAEKGVAYNLRSQGVPKGGPGKEIFVDSEIIVFATGFKRPSLSFLPDKVFEEPYAPPNWYLQTFPPGCVDICANNCTYVNAIGTVGHFHIGVYTRILLMFLIDPLTRPSGGAMKLWIGWTRFLKSRSPTPAFDFFTYGELLWWFFECIVVNPFRWKWALFIMFGWGRPMWVIEKERMIRGYEKIERGPI